MFYGLHETHISSSPREPRARARAARRRSRHAHRSGRDPRDHARHRAELPGESLPGREPHDRLPGQGGRRAQPAEHAASGTIVAWTITLGKPNATQIKFFNANEGGDAEAGIAVLRPLPKPHLTYKLIAQSPPVKLEPYFGKTAQFPLETTIPVKKGDVIALTVPTWAPALALGFGNDTSWRASRQKTQCTSTSTQTAHTRSAARCSTSASTRPRA